MSDLSALIERLEKATGPDRELDAEIWWRVNRPDAERTYWNAAMGKPRPLGDAFPPNGMGRLAILRQAPDYTASLDAAMMLARHQVDLIVMLHTAFKAVEDARGPVNLWPSIKATLIASLRARLAGEKG